LKEDCNVVFFIKENSMKLIFNVIFNKKYKYTFDIILKPKSIKSEMKSEYQYQKEIKSLNDKIDTLVLEHDLKIKKLDDKIETLMLDQELKIKSLNDKIETLMLEYQDMNLVLTYLSDTYDIIVGKTTDDIFGDGKPKNIMCKINSTDIIIGANIYIFIK